MGKYAVIFLDFMVCFPMSLGSRGSRASRLFELKLGTRCFCFFAASCQLYMRIGKYTFEGAFHRRKWSIIILSFARKPPSTSVSLLCINSHICWPENLGEVWLCSWTSTRGLSVALRSMDFSLRYVFITHDNHLKAYVQPCRPTSTSCVVSFLLS